MMVNLLSFSTKELFLELGKVGWTHTVLALFISYPILWFLTESKKYICIQKLNLWFAAGILFISILKSPSLFMSLGLVLLSLVLFLYFYLGKEKIAYIFLAVDILSFPKLLLQTSANLQDKELGIFTFTISESKLPTLIWPVLVAVIVAVLIGFLLSKVSLAKVNETWVRRLTVVTIIGGVFYVLYLSIVAYYKIKANAVSSFDIGIFSQMFERMRHDFSQVTTLERDRALSHFGVHISPIYYLILPFYMLFPYVETLDIAQTVIVFSAVIPLCLILKKIQLPKVMTPLVLALFFVTPVMTTSGGFHLHENCFLPPLILWLFYSLIFSVAWKNYLVHLVAPFCERGCLCLRAVLRTLFCFSTSFYIRGQV